MQYSTYGRHTVVDVWGVDASFLDNVDFLRLIMVNAAVKSSATVLSVIHKKFEPSGCSILVLLSESHLSIHTYPKEGFAAIDGYTCGKRVDPKIAVDYLVDILQPKKIYTKTLIRGSNEIVVLD
ncbi:adenosylmethionine decarboxylase [Paenibacillus sp. Soil787]|uniref:adenosylmethionine decarboxylase n=1 Tax=Paenibacillus sp. Soil787 TaxID=1736411 RepID=UPI000703A3C9|nr:adenosylmethionine decarboxylase [Paenibacillus sp. Soil787]KRF18714.1 S-adenosylmethionine decarboxylase proenzyme [Paenibacillus sp. Soil787]